MFVGLEEVGERVGEGGSCWVGFLVWKGLFWVSFVGEGLYWALSTSGFVLNRLDSSWKGVVSLGEAWFVAVDGVCGV